MEGTNQAPRPRVVAVDTTDPDSRAIAEAARCILGGGLVAFATETVYGLGALASDADAVARIYRAKGRPAHNPLIAHVADAAAARALAAHWSEGAEALARAFWPGPLTLVVERAPGAVVHGHAGLSTVAVRVPAAPIALALLRAVGAPVVAPSANPSGRLSPTRAEHVVRGLGERVDLVLDGGPCAVGIESSVVDLSGRTPRLLRHGTLDVAALRAVAPELEASGRAPLPGEARGSPGLDPSHYAPRAVLEVLPRAQIAARIRDFPGPHGRIVRESIAGTTGHERVLGDRPEVWAQRLYDELHSLDALGVERVWVETPPADPAWWGVADRLRRAAAPRP